MGQAPKMTYKAPKMTYKLWLDDQLDDPDCPARHVPDGFLGAKSCDEAIALVTRLGPPVFMDLDCDLGDGKDAKSFVNWLIENHFDNPPGWRIHSANIVESPNIESKMRSWHRVAKGSAS